MRKSIPVIFAAALVGTASAGAAGAVGEQPVPTHLWEPLQATRTYTSGPIATESRGETDIAGGYGGVDPLIVHTPGTTSSVGTYDALITMSFRYRTRGATSATTYVHVATAEAPRVPAKTRPRTPAPLPRSPQSTSTSVQFVAASLRKNETYRFSPVVSIPVPQKVGTFSAALTDVVLTVQFTPHG